MRTFLNKGFHHPFDQQNVTTLSPNQIIYKLVSLNNMDILQNLRG